MELFDRLLLCHTNNPCIDNMIRLSYPLWVYELLSIDLAMMSAASEIDSVIIVLTASKPTLVTTSFMVKLGMTRPTALLLGFVLQLPRTSLI
jgi:hypothetical protein